MPLPYRGGASIAPLNNHLPHYRHVGGRFVNRPYDTLSLLHFPEKSAMIGEKEWNL